MDLSDYFGLSPLSQALQCFRGVEPVEGVSGPCKPRHYKSMEDEGATRVTLPEVRSLHNLLKVTEELLFSFPLSADLVRKYEMLREGAFLKAVIHSASKIRRMQKEAHTQQRTTISPKETQTDNRPSTPPPPQVSSYNSSPEPMSFALNLSRGWT